MNILVLFSSSEIGGVEKSISRMVKASSDDDMHYTLASMAPKGAWYNWAKELNLSPISFLNSQQTMPSGIFALIKYLLKEKPDFIYVCGLRLSLYLRFLKFFLPRVKIIQAVRWNPSSESVLDKRFRFIEKWFGWLIYYYIANSTVAKDTLISMCNISQDKCNFVHNGIPTPGNVNSSDHNTRKNHVLYIANLHHVKGHVAFLDTIKRVIRINSNVHFFFIGRDDLNGLVQKEVKRNNLENHITFTGFLSDIEPYLMNAKLSVLPSLHEGSPTSILESMVLGVPVIAHDIDGIPELISNNEDGVLVPIADYDAFANHIISLIQDEPLRHQYGQNAKIKILKHFTDKKCADNHAKILKEILKK